MNAKRRTPTTRTLSKLLVSLLCCLSTILCLLAPAYAQSLAPDDVKHDTLGQIIKQGQALRLNVELALVNVTVADPYDRLVTGLEPESFRVFEDNVEQEIVSFSSEDVPVSIGVILDFSGSMATRLAEPSKLRFSSLKPQILKTSSF